MTNEEAAQLARMTAAAWIRERLEAGWPDTAANVEDARRLRRAMWQVARVLTPSSCRRTIRRDPETVFLDAPTRPNRPGEPEDSTLRGESTICGEDSTLRGED